MSIGSKKAATLADFNAIYNPNVRIPRKIEAALAALLAEGSEAHEDETSFMKRCGVGNTQFAMFRDQFDKHFVLVRASGKSSDKRIWFGDAKVAAKAARAIRGEV